MKKKVELSTYSLVMSCLVMAVFIGIFLWQYSRTNTETYCWILLGIIVVWAFFTLFYAPMYISFDGEVLSIHRPIRIKKIPVSEIESVSLCPVTMTERKLFGSGGFFGYWGWFSRRDTGKYFAYYGKPSDAFLVILKDGSRYMPGCRDVGEIVTLVNSYLKANH